MRTLKFIITGQKIAKDPDCDFSGIVAGTEGYLHAIFLASQEWAGCRMAAIFSCLGKWYVEPIKNNWCIIPKEVLTWNYFGVQVVGQRENYRITTNEIKVDQERR